jgi:radical SAM protein with 4Fe4S-binding SPASM domain
VSIVDEAGEPVEVIERLTDPDPFLAARQTRNVLSQCRNANPCSGDDIRYLWIDAAHLDATQTTPVDVPSSLTVEEWLNVIDEAAALGVNWLVISLHQCCDAGEAVGEMFRWAQQTYGMNTALHTRCSGLDPSAGELLRQLDPQLTYVFVCRDHLDAWKQLEAEQGIRVRIANPELESKPETCAMATGMIFVNPQGQLYTCGLVNGDGEYRLGNIFEERFHAVLRDQSLPHEVPLAPTRASHGCDGCPPLVARHVLGEMA